MDRELQDGLFCENFNRVDELPIESFDVDKYSVQQNVEKITQSLDEVIDKCNADPDYAHPFYSEHLPDYLSIKKTAPWPEFVGGAYVWQVSYDLGTEPIGISENSDALSGTVIHYFPAPQEAADRLAMMDAVKARWFKDNPDIDLSKGLLSTPMKGDLNAPNVVSNDYDIILATVLERFEALKESRKI
jgi:hypothetical protein